MQNTLVIGSINMDLVIQTARLPKLGETVMGQGFSMVPGGKGANQAVAAARLGSRVKMLGCLGSDVYGDVLLEHLRVSGVLTDSILRADSSSGVAVITVCQGDNHIILDPGANGKLDADAVRRSEALIAWADTLLLQFEIPMDAVETAMELAERYGTRVVLNPSPMKALRPELYPKVGLLVVNEFEAGQLLGREICSLEDAGRAIAGLEELGFREAVITLGKRGSVFRHDGRILHQDIFRVETVDTTGAGDSFLGGLCAALGRDMAIPEAVRFAAAASALAVSRMGAGPSIPTRQETENFLKQVHSG